MPVKDCFNRISRETPGGIDCHLPPDLWQLQKGAQQAMPGGHLRCDSTHLQCFQLAVLGGLQQRLDLGALLQRPTGIPTGTRLCVASACDGRLLRAVLAHDSETVLMFLT